VSTPALLCFALSSVRYWKFAPKPTGEEEVVYLWWLLVTVFTGYGGALHLRGKRITVALLIANGGITATVMT
jgi:hypothetical protein